MTYVSSFERSAIEKGVQQGMQQGMQQGEALALQKLLSKRFGVIPEEIMGRIARASTEQIDAWLDGVLEAPNLDALFTAARH
jgi:flagellar biosynthesis/type III secretory pathway protein FliH